MWNFSPLIFIRTTKLDWYLLLIYDTNTPINTGCLSFNQVVRNLLLFIQDPKRRIKNLLYLGNQYTNNEIDIKLQRLNISPHNIVVCIYQSNSSHIECHLLRKILIARFNLGGWFVRIQSISPKLQYEANIKRINIQLSHRIQFMKWGKKENLCERYFDDKWEKSDKGGWSDPYYIGTIGLCTIYPYVSSVCILPHAAVHFRCDLYSVSFVEQRCTSWGVFLLCAYIASQQLYITKYWFSITYMRSSVCVAWRIRRIYRTTVVQQNPKCRHFSLRSQQKRKTGKDRNIVYNNALNGCCQPNAIGLKIGNVMPNDIDPIEILNMHSNGVSNKSK